MWPTKKKTTGKYQIKITSLLPVHTIILLHFGGVGVTVFHSFTPGFSIYLLLAPLVFVSASEERRCRHRPDAERARRSVR